MNCILYILAMQSYYDSNIFCRFSIVILMEVMYMARFCKYVY